MCHQSQGINLCFCLHLSKKFKHAFIKKIKFNLNSTLNFRCGTHVLRGCHHTTLQMDLNPGLNHLYLVSTRIHVENSSGWIFLCCWKHFYIVLICLLLARIVISKFIFGSLLIMLVLVRRSNNTTILLYSLRNCFWCSILTLWCLR